MSNDRLILFFALFLAILAIVGLAILAFSSGMKKYRERFVHDTDEKLSELFLFVDPQKLFALNLVALLVLPAAVFVVTDSGFKSLVSFIALLLLPRLALKFLRKQRHDKFEFALPDALAQIAGSLRAGSTLPSAMEMLVNETKGPISQEFSLVLRENRLGIAMEQALENLAKRIPVESLQLTVSAALIARDVGGNLAETFERLSDTLRQKLKMEAKIKALTSQGKLQGWVVGLLPLGMILVLFQMEPQSMQFLTSGLLGWIFIAVIVVMEMLGIYMIMKIVDIDV